MEWKQRARIKLQVDKKLDDWTPDRIQFLCDRILGQFCLDVDSCDLGVHISDQGRMFVEFTAALTNDSVSAMMVVQALEYAFFDLKIQSREVVVEKRK